VFEGPKTRHLAHLFPLPAPTSLEVLRIRDPGSRIPDPKTAANERGEKKFFVIPFYVATNFTKLKIILVLTC
jgi:hypothetical protein